MGLSSRHHTFILFKTHPFLLWDSCPLQRVLLFFSDSTQRSRSHWGLSLPWCSKVPEFMLILLPSYILNRSILNSPSKWFLSQFANSLLTSLLLFLSLLHSSPTVQQKQPWGGTVIPFLPRLEFCGGSPWAWLLVLTSVCVQAFALTIPKHLCSFSWASWTPQGQQLFLLPIGSQHLAQCVVK